MGCFDTYCILCGCSCYFPKYNDDDYLNIDDKKFKMLQKITEWLKKCTILTANNMVIHNCDEINCNDTFSSPNNDEYVVDMMSKSFTYPYVKNKGLFIHNDCWTYIMNKYNIELKFGDLAIINNFYGSVLPYVNYMNIGKYNNSQHFDFPSIIKDNNIWMCTSPLKCEKNAKRIDKIFSQLKLKKNRKGPAMSASSYNNGSIKIGNNNKFWIKEKGKWVEMKGTINTMTIELEKKHYRIPQVGEYNIKSIFIQDFITKNKKNYVKIIYI